MIYIEEEGVS